jgi:hypothetical protein
MKKTVPLKSYFNRARLFGYILVAIAVCLAGYLIYTSFFV